MADTQGHAEAPYINAGQSINVTEAMVLATWRTRPDRSGSGE